MIYDGPGPRGKVSSKRRVNLSKDGYQVESATRISVNRDWRYGRLVPSLIQGLAQARMTMAEREVYGGLIERVRQSTDGLAKDSNQRRTRGLGHLEGVFSRESRTKWKGIQKQCVARSRYTVVTRWLHKILR